MKRLEELITRIIDRANVNLREPAFDVGPYVRNLVPLPKFAKFYAFYGLTSHHPLHFHFKYSSLAGSYFLGKCLVDYSVLYKSDIRGDELKSKGEAFAHRGLKIPLHHDEVIRIKDSFLIKNLVHNNSHDPECPEEFELVVSFEVACGTSLGIRYRQRFLNRCVSFEVSCEKLQDKLVLIIFHLTSFDGEYCTSAHTTVFPLQIHKCFSSLYHVGENISYIKRGKKIFWSWLRSTKH